jgi:uncharacterized protein involved in response to NO
MPSRFYPAAWQVDEMPFGFVLATMVGFLVTAILNWIGRLPGAGFASARSRVSGYSAPVRPFIVFVVLNVAAIARIFASWPTAAATILLRIAGLCWTLAFGLFELICNPTFLARRPAS